MNEKRNAKNKEQKPIWNQRKTKHTHTQRRDEHYFCAVQCVLLALFTSLTLALALCFHKTGYWAFGFWIERDYWARSHFYNCSNGPTTTDCRQLHNHK